MKRQTQKRKPTSMQLPIQLRSPSDRAELWCSDENQCVSCGMVTQGLKGAKLLFDLVLRKKIYALASHSL